jgi:trigger factor
MDIQQEKVDELNAVLKIKLAPEDYKPQVDKALKQYKKQVNMPGFRPGMVPMSVVKKQYGKSVLAEEINKVLSETIQKHIEEKELNILGNPLPKETDQVEGDWDDPQEFKFEYDLALAPDFEIKLSAKDKFTYHKIKIDKKLIDQQVKDLAKRYGKMSEPKESGETDMLMGQFVELDEKDEIKEGGIMQDATISVEFVEDKATKKKLTGLKVGDEVVVDPHKVSKGHDDLAKMLEISHEQVHDIKTNFRFKVNEIKRLEPAEVNQELFDKIYGEGEIKSVDEFRKKVAEDLEKTFETDQKRLLQRDITKKLIDKINPTLPDEFLKRWIKMANEKPLTEEQIEEDYPNYSRSLKWQLIENKFIKDNDLKVEPEEAVNHVKKMMAEQYAQYGLPADEEQLNMVAQQALSNKEESQRIFENLYEEKVIETIKEKVKVDEKEVSMDKFIEMANEG